MIGYSTVTQKGQVTIPVDIRRLANIAPRRQVMITASEDGVKISPVADIMSLYGSVKPRYRPEHFKQMRREFIKYLANRSRK